MSMRENRTDSSERRPIFTVFGLVLACFAIVWFGGSPLGHWAFILVSLSTSATVTLLIAVVWPQSGKSDPRAKFVFGFTLAFSLMSALFVAIWVSGGDMGLLDFVVMAVAAAVVCGVVGGVANVLLND